MSVARSFHRNESAASAANPWSEAAAEQESWSRSALTLNLQDEPCVERYGDEDDQDCVDHMVRKVLYAWHVLDGIMALSLFIYLFVMEVFRPSSDEANGAVPPPHAAVVWVMVFAMVLLVRCLLGVGSAHFASTNWVPKALLMSTIIGFLLACLYGLLSLVVLAKPEQRRLLKYIWKHLHELHMSHSFGHYLENHKHSVTFMFLVCCGVEVIRCVITYQYQQVLVDDATDPLGRSNASGARRPWWWRQDSRRPNDMQDPLLGDSNWGAPSESDHGGRGSAKPSFWSRLFRRSEEDNPRDDASVDFESVHKEWESRSLEDPLWWTKEGNWSAATSVKDRQRPAGIDNSFDDNTDTSWAPQGAGISSTERT